MKRNLKKEKYKKNKELTGPTFGNIRSVWHKSEIDYDRKKVKLQLKREYGLL